MSIASPWIPLAALCTLTIAGLAQEPTPSGLQFRELAVPGSREPLRYGLMLPPGYEPGQRHPLLLALPGGEQDDKAVTVGCLRRWGAIGQEWIVASPACAGRETALPAFLSALRQEFRIDQGGIHLLGLDRTGVASVWRLATAVPHEFQTITVWPPQVPEDTAPLARLRGRRAVLFTGPVEAPALAALAEQVARLRELGLDARLDDGAVAPHAETFARHFQALHKPRDQGGIVGELSVLLDDFHDAATKGDEERYFQILVDDAVFLGTDATERWTGTEFRSFAMPYFERGPAWTYVPVSRHVTMGPNGALAWFDEVLDNEAYGECRGSGVLQLREGQWVLRQYNLTIPVPNDLARGVVARIRAFAERRAPAVTTVVVVRHAEKEGEGKDPGLNEAGQARAAALAKALQALSVQAAYTSPFRRTRETLGPLCAARGLQPIDMPAEDVKGLAARIKKQDLGRTVVVAGHSNTVPQLLQALGVSEPVVLGEQDFDRLFVVTIGVDGARLLALHY